MADRERCRNRNDPPSVVLKQFSAFLKNQNADFHSNVLTSNVFIGKCPKAYFPIRLENHPQENINILDIIESDNRIFNKVIAVFAILCEEIKNLQNEAKNHFNFLAFYGEFSKEKKLSIEETMGAHIKQLHDLTNFVKRCYDVAENLSEQLVALYSCNFLKLKGISLDFILSSLGSLLVILITVDSLIAISPLQNHWTAYRKSIKEVFESADRSTQDLKILLPVLNNIEEKILSNKIFQNCVESLHHIKSKMNKSNFALSNNIISFMKRCLGELERNCDELSQSPYSIYWVKLNAIFVFHFLVFGNADKKLFKNLVDTNLKCHTIPLYGLAMFFPEQFLLCHAEVLCTSYKLTQVFSKARDLSMSKKKEVLSKTIHLSHLNSVKWTLEMNKIFNMKDNQLNASDLNDMMNRIDEGLKFIGQVNYVVTTFMNMHITQGKPIAKSSLLIMYKLIELSKAAQIFFKHNSAHIASMENLFTQHLLYLVLNQILTAKKNLMSDRNYNSHLDELTAIVIAERALRGPIVLKRKIVAKIALAFVHSSLFPDDSYTKIMESLERLDQVTNILNTVDNLCNFFFIYWQRYMVPIYLENVFTMRKDVGRINFIIDALNDCSEAIYQFEKYTSTEGCLEIFNKEIEGYFSDQILKPLGHQIETNLRLHAHSHLQVAPNNPFDFPIEDNNALVNLKNYRFNNFYVSMFTAVEHYLSHMFYNLTTVVLHNWKTYGEMRQLAKFKFDLHPIEDHLPTQTLEQGLDVLEIMRNIHIFVSKYLYNLNNQVFIERNSNGKYLNTINIRHIANSIRTHGIGIMNTTVNFTYQFLRKTFHTFSQLMYDEQIKSRLMKDLRQFRQITHSQKMYSYKRAEKFNKNIRNLGLDENNHSYLDKLRLLISHVGNAMGYVRMVRSGGLHCCANAAMFLPSLDEESYEFLLLDGEVGSTVKDSMDNLESTIKNLTSNFSHGTDYFKLLIDVFAPVFRSKDNVHLKPFFMIVPPLTLNYVENMLLCKDRMGKKIKDGAAFTDDGFAMGLAYILRLLDQDEGMNSLSWFESVTGYISDERKSIAEQMAAGTTDHLQHALALTEKKLNLLEQEFQLLYFSFSSARIFFQQ